MKLNRITGFIFGCLIMAAGAKAQSISQRDTLLTLKDAVGIALKNNYDIQISTNSSTIASNNVTLGNAGILPTVSANAVLTNSLVTTTQTRSDNTVNQINGANNTARSYGVNMDWTIFDGFNMFANYDALKQQNQLDRIRLQDTLQRTVANVINTYFDLVNQKKKIQALQGVIGISRTQLRFANDKFSVGTVARLDVYNAQVALNTDTASLITQLQQYKASKIDLNVLLARNPQTEFTVADTIIIDNSLLLSNVINQAQTQNPGILSAAINQRLAEISLKQVRSTRYPLVSVNTGYEFNNSANPAAFASRQRSHGLTYGLAASINIFDGFNQWRRERNAKLQIDNAGLNTKQTRLEVESQINSLYSSYLSGIDLIKIGQANVELSRKSLEISLEKYRIGTITPLEIREAQRNYLNAVAVFFDAEYQSKMAETTLKQITGNISLQ